MAIKTQEIQALKKLIRLTNYLAASQIYLKDNVLLERELTHADIKPRLLGHWGTCPGINFVYAQIHRLITTKKQKMLFVVGPGHGFPAVQANLFLEGSLSHFYPDKIPYSKAGLKQICKKFSAPYGYPSHANPEAPGIILEGGELGYSLSVAFGSVLDNPDLITACLVGDGESETGPLAAAWQVNKLLSPRENGAVLPILHLNGYKISGPTFFGRMSKSQIEKYFSGLGYEPIFVGFNKSKDIYLEMTQAMEKAYAKIKQIQKDAKKKDIGLPIWPVIIMQTLKGWTGPKHEGQKKLEGNNLSHQVVLGDVAKNDTELRELNKWLGSYQIQELISEKNGKLILDKDIQSLLPKKGLSTGTQPLAFGGKVRKDLKLPDPKKLCVNTKTQSPMKLAGKYLKEVFKKNNNCRFFSPDETTSNRLDAILDVTTRSWQLPIKPWDFRYAREGKVMEMLSEHTLFGLLHGYTITGRHGLMTSYEAFMQVAASMADQYLKFIKASLPIHFRDGVPPLNIILTSLLERQDHNGFSHQNPAFIAGLLEKDGGLASVYLPPDANSTLFVLDKMLRGEDRLNTLVAGKQDSLPVWLTATQAEKQTRDGILTWKTFSEEDPQVVLVGCGDYAMQEVMAARKMLFELLPLLRVRLVCVSELSALGLGNPQADIHLNDYFTEDKPVIINFHGYAATIKKLIFDYCGTSRIMVRGYTEEGSTTSPFDMMLRNQTSRYHLVRDAVIQAYEAGELSKAECDLVEEAMEKKMAEHHAYIEAYGDDPPSISNWF